MVLSVHKLAEHLSRLECHFLFLPRNVRNDVIEDVQRRDTWITGARERLHRRYNHSADSERLVQRGEGSHQSGRRTIWIRDNKPATRKCRLRANHLKMPWVHLWNEEGDIRAHTMCRGIGKYFATRRCKLLLQGERLVRRKSAKYHVAVKIYRTIAQDHFCGLLWRVGR